MERYTQSDRSMMDVLLSIERRLDAIEKAVGVKSQGNGYTDHRGQYAPPNEDFRDQPRESQQERFGIK